jgi:hypothetical protein
MKKFEMWGRLPTCGRLSIGLPMALMIAGLPLAAETASERGKRIVNECVEALGGQKFLAVNDIVQSGRAYSFYRDKLTGLTIARTATRYLNKVEDPSQTLAILERQDFGKKLDYGILFQQDDAYEITFRGARPLATDRFERYKHYTIADIFYILRERLHEPGLIFEGRGADVWNNFPIEIVEITDARNEVVTVYFHKTTKLPVREVSTRRDPATKEKIDEETLYTKYRESDGVQWPLTVQRNRNGERIYEMFSDSLEIDKKLPDKNMFELPAGMKKLKPG